jgi:predicted  nucleic acid-binding Zn-ribbon protein
MPEIPTEPNNGTTLYRLNRLDKEIDDQQDDIDKLKDRIGKLEIELGKMQERITIFQAAQATFTTIAGVIAAFIGRIP